MNQICLGRRMQKWILMVSMAVLLLFGFMSERVHAADITEVTFEVQFRQSAAREMLSLINSFRTGKEAYAWNSSNTGYVYYDCKAVQYDYTLEKIAMQRAVDMAVHFAHTRPNGNRWNTVHIENGFQGTYAGENLTGSTSSSASAASYAMSNFKEDNEKYSGQGHRRNMLNPRFTHVGIACIYYNGCYYWVQEFGENSVSISPTAANNSATTVKTEVLSSLVTSSSFSSPITKAELQSGDSMSLPNVSATFKTSETWPTSKTITATAKPNYSVADSSVARVEGNTLIGVSGGSTTLTLSALNKTFSIPVTVKGAALITPGSTEIISAESTENGVQLSWSKANQADGYYVYRSVDNGSWAQIKQTTATSLLDAAVESGKNYSYKVVAYKDNSGTIVKGEESPVKSIVYQKPATGPIITVGKVTLANPSLELRSVKLSWSADASADGYYIYRRMISDLNGKVTTSFMKIAETAGRANTAWEDTTVASGCAYEYQIVAYQTINAIRYEGEASNTGSVFYLQAPENLKLENTAEGIRLTWDAVAGGKTYQIFRSANGKSFDVLATTSYINSYVDENVTEGVTYYYKLWVITPDWINYCNRNTPSTSIVYSKPSVTPVITVNTPMMRNVTVQSASLNLTWESVSEADGYQIYRRMTANSAGAVSENYQLLQTVGGSGSVSYNDVSVKSGCTYEYYVIAYRTVNGKTYKSDASSSLKKPFVEAPSGIRAEQMEEKIHLTWNAADGAAAYVIYRKSGSSQWSIAGYAAETVYDDTKVTDGVSYSYTVAACDSNHVLLSAYDTEGKTITYTAPVIPEEPVQPEISVGKVTLSNPSLELHSVKLSWSADASADGYYIYRRMISDLNGKVTTSFMKIAETAGRANTAWEDTTVVSGCAYEYQIVAYQTINAIRYEGEASNTGSVFYLQAPENLKLENTAEGIRLTWDAVAGGKTYQIFRSTNGKSFDLIGATSYTTSYVDKNVTEGVKYYYRLWVITPDWINYCNRYTPSENITYTRNGKSTASYVQTMMLEEELLEPEGLSIMSFTIEDEGEQEYILLMPENAEMNELF